MKHQSKLKDNKLLNFFRVTLDWREKASWRADGDAHAHKSSPFACAPLLPLPQVLY